MGSAQVPGFSLDLSEMRLVQVEGHEPAWVSELEKVQIYSYMDSRV